MIVGIVKNRSVEKNRDGEKNVRMLGVDLYMNDNTESVQLARPSGEDSNPPDDAIIYVLPAGYAYKIGFVIDDGITPGMDKGEKKIYSVNAGAIKAYINLLKNGNIELNGNSKGVARQDDTIQLKMSGIDIQSLAASLLTTGAFVPTGSPPAPASVPLTFTDGKITSSSGTVKTG